MSTQLDERTDLETVTENEDPIVTHIVGKDEDKSADAKVTEALINGTPVTALCGHVWVPSRNPEKHPVCEKCLEIFWFDKQFTQ